MFRAILVDDQPIFRDIIRGVLQRTGRFNFVGEAEDGLQAVNLFLKAKPDVVIMDVQMPNLSGFEATVRILEEDPDAVVILTSMQADAGYSAVATQAGAKGFVPKRHLDAESILNLLTERSDQGFLAA
jgi:DNA-binding NarL/FixJ family response regulator